MKTNTDTNYRIRGFTGPNPDFSFTVHADIMPYGDALRDIVLAHFKHECDWTRDLEASDTYDLTDAAERSDLRDTDSQRVYLFNGEDCIVHEDNNTCDGNDCDSDLYMITVDVEGE